ncbi:MAG: DUF309 domain-containing protein [Pirellulales bacterium]
MNGHESHGGHERLVPDERLPPYSYVTGRFPHPTRDSSGHSFGRPPDAPPPVHPDRWSQSRTYLLGCDLFNLGYYWEAHETWEAVWKACGRRGAVADFLKALIKLAAAGVKAREGRPTGVQRHAARAAQLLRGVRNQISAATYLGLDVDELIAIADRLKRGIELPEPSAAPVQIVFGFRLLPRSGDSMHDAG